jgi:hypothetical protein
MPAAAAKIANRFMCFSIIPPASHGAVSETRLETKMESASAERIDAITGKLTKRL